MKTKQLTYCPECGSKLIYKFKNAVYDTDTGDQVAIRWDVRCPEFTHYGNDLVGQQHVNTRREIPVGTK